MYAMAGFLAAAAGCGVTTDLRLHPQAYHVHMETRVSLHRVLPGGLRFCVHSFCGTARRIGCNAPQPFCSTATIEHGVLRHWLPASNCVLGVLPSHSECWLMLCVAMV